MIAIPTLCLSIVILTELLNSLKITTYFEFNMQSFVVSCLNGVVLWPTLNSVSAIADFQCILEYKLCSKLSFCTAY